MRANARDFLIIIGVAAVAAAIVLTLYENYEYLILIGIFLIFLMIAYLGLGIES